MLTINQYIDHTKLDPTATADDIVQLCEEARKFEFFAVCIHGGFVKLAKRTLLGTTVKVCAVAGFPLGASAPVVKQFEAKQAIADGADEIDMVLNLGLLKSKEFSAVQEEISLVKKTIGKNVLKVIIETCYLNSQEITQASELAVKAGADYVKTSTGFGSSGAHLQHIDLIKRAVDGKARIKASGGIRSLDVALSYLEAGVERIGTSSGVSIVKELRQ